MADSAEEPVLEPVEPRPAETEPAAGTHLLATEGQDEVAVAHLPERQSGIHELEVGIAPPVGIGKGCPYGHDTRMEPRIGLTQSAREAQVGMVFRIHAEGAADDLPLVQHEEHLGGFHVRMLPAEQTEEALVGEVLSHLRGVVAAEHLQEGVQFGFGLRFLQYDTLFQHLPDLAHPLRIDTFFGRKAVERVVHTYPVDGEVPVPAEILVGEERLGEVPELDEETFFPDFGGEVFQQDAEQLVLGQCMAEVFARAEHLAPLDDGGREEAHAPPDDGQQLRHGLPVDGGHDQHGGIAGCLSVHLEQLGRVGKTLSRQGRQRASVAVCHQLDGFHTCKFSVFC